MMAKIRERMANEDKGFTLIELLVVMIIIGILAAIAIPLFLNQRAKAAETAAKADATAIGKEVMAYYVDGTADDLVVADDGAGNWTVTSATDAALALTGSLSGENTADGQGTDASDWCVVVDPSATNADAGPWSYDAAQGLVAGDVC